MTIIYTIYEPKEEVYENRGHVGKPVFFQYVKQDTKKELYIRFFMVPPTQRCNLSGRADKVPSKDNERIITKEEFTNYFERYRALECCNESGK